MTLLSTISLDLFPTTNLVPEHNLALPRNINLAVLENSKILL